MISIDKECGIPLNSSQFPLRPWATSHLSFDHMHRGRVGLLDQCGWKDCETFIVQHNRQTDTRSISATTECSCLVSHSALCSQMNNVEDKCQQFALE